ncbi:hypothetical protein GYH30_019080 [Glycine max]|uniref:Uncharacterized protein n=1 Tax=Glycine max TaxID=3847 RepID=A0A0R0J5Z8_SOYBN|nr:hypothetical protein GYH30_019080 [Glycine max]KHN31039.1 hypothetical protein glysoja_020337 [Glycine soja]
MSLVLINYAERPLRESASKEKDEVDIVIPEGTNPEVYTEEQDKLLGDCESTWELYVDGYDEDGNRIYDPIKGEACHQCRYGENVVEVHHNTKWTCLLVGIFATTVLAAGEKVGCLLAKYTVG